MAIATFQGITSDWDDTDNWVGGAGAGGVPANNDTIVIAQSSQDLDTNLVTTLTGITLYIGEGYTGTIGASANHLDLDGPLFQFSGRGTSCYCTGVWTTVEVLGGIASDTMLNFKANATTDIGTMHVMGGSGTVAVGTDAVLDDLIVSAREITVDIGVVTSLDNVTILGGVVELDAAVAVGILITGGKVTVGAASVPTLITMAGNCVVQYDSSGTLATLKAYDGTFDGTQNDNGVVAITTATQWDGVIDFRNGLGTWTGVTVLHLGGILRPYKGSSVAIT